MAEKHILGLDLGTNSIGWAVVAENDGQKSILHAGSRILPMDAEMMGKFESGNTVSQTGERTAARGIRRLFERRALRRERLNRVLSLMGFLPPHYERELNRYGQLHKGAEPKIAWKTTEGKTEFLFQDAFDEMLREFAAAQPESVANGKKIPYDWTIYYLRKKALTRPVSKQELAWILHQFNQKRGYNQARGEEEETKPNERKELVTLKVADVRDTGEQSKGRTWYEVVLENGWIYKRQSTYPLDWTGKSKDFVVTTKLNADGTESTDKEGKVKRSISAPSDEDWGLRKIKTEHDIEQSGKSVGEFVYDALLQKPEQKILGELVRVVDRKYYKDELRRILETQAQYIPELRDKELYRDAIHALYPQNEAYRNSIANRDFVYLLLQDIIFYQRPLKSKKSLINECPYEYHVYQDKNGEWKRRYLKCISKSHPLYEEFRMWQFAENLHIYKEDAKGIGKDDCTAEYLSDKAEVVEWLLGQKEVTEKSLLARFVGKKANGFSWNYVSDKKYPAAPVYALLSSALKEAGGEDTDDEIVHIWHILYSVSDREQLQKALTRYAAERGLSSVFAEKLGRQKPFAADYGAYSEKAIRRLLGVMRCGGRWHAEDIDARTRTRIEHLLTAEADNTITNQVREKLLHMNEVSDFQGLPLWLAEYVVYDVRKNDTKWESPEDIDRYIQSFRLHSLNNPIVEQVVLESLRTVRDIWRQEGHIDEIHIELGRELKQNAEQRKRMQERQLENEAANLRAKRLLQEFMNPEMEVEGVRAYSPVQQEILRIYEEGVLESHPMNEDIQPVMKRLGTANPSASDVKKYRLWLDQKYISPYTGQPIPLGKLFTPAYQIEHVIPQSRYFDDSMSNKVICEAEVNARKGRMLAHEFIAACGGEKITLSGGKVVPVLGLEDYEVLVKETYKGAKREKLMLDDIPEKFIARQMNDSHYISRLMLGLMSNIVREKNDHGEYEPEMTGKNVVACNGATTTRLKKDCGINDVWNRIILPRFERMNKIDPAHRYTATTANGHVIPSIPSEFEKGFNKKRIDHRHHAMDAIVIALTTRNHVNLLSNEAALDKDEQARRDLQVKLRKQEKWVDGKGNTHVKFTGFVAPYEGFQKDVQTTLENIVVSFKQNMRVINKTKNLSMRFVDGKKQLVQQTKGEHWAIRKPMHKDTVFGEVNLRFKKTANLSYALQHVGDVVDRDLRCKLRELLSEGRDEKQIKKYFASEPDVWADVDLKRIEVYYFTRDSKERFFAVRTELDKSFTQDKIGKITDEGIRKILLAHLERCAGNPDTAFSPDGIEQMNADIQALNKGVAHKPIHKVRVYEKADKFAVGKIGAKSKKFVEAAKGTNLFFAIYITRTEDGQEQRSFVTPPFRAVLECQKAGGKNWKTHLDQWIHANNLVAEDAVLTYLLSPGDLVYLPTEEERVSGEHHLEKGRIYKMVSFSGRQAFFIPYMVASSIVDKQEYSTLNKMERAITGEMIKETCIPIHVDRLGNVALW